MKVELELNGGKAADDIPNGWMPGQLPKGADVLKNNDSVKHVAKEKIASVRKYGKYNSEKKNTVNYMEGY
jgi:hypothetical protein